MAVFTKGQTIEVGIGESIHDENGWSEYIFVDVETISEGEVEGLLTTSDILYIDAVTDEYSVRKGKENPLSGYLK